MQVEVIHALGEGGGILQKVRIKSKVKVDRYRERERERENLENKGVGFRAYKGTRIYVYIYARPPPQDPYGRRFRLQTSQTWEF